MSVYSAKLNQLLEPVIPSQRSVMSLSQWQSNRLKLRGLLGHKVGIILGVQFPLSLEPVANSA